MKIALVSVGLGRVLRGFESFTESLFQWLNRLAPDLNITVFQGGGQPAPRRVVISHFFQQGSFASWLGDRKALLLEKRSFALALYPHLRRGKFDIVHYNELTLGSALYHLRRLLGGKFKLLYCNGSPALPVHYQHRCDFAQMLTGPAHDEAQAASALRGRLFLIPYGIDAQRFHPQNRLYRQAIRKELQIPDTAKVILTVGLFDRKVKRIDYIIREVSSMQNPAWLVVAGQPTPEKELLEKLAHQLIPGRWRFVSWPQERMPLLYGAADIFTLASLAEGFGLVTVEAMFTGLPVILHNGPIFRWLAQGTPAQCIDMSREGELRQALELTVSKGDFPSFRGEALRRFSWEALIPQYRKMYERIGPQLQLEAS